MVDEDAPDDPETETINARRRPAIPDKLCLVVVSGPDQGKKLVLERGTYHVGKAADCDLALPHDRAVSRHHLRVEIGPRAVRFRDLDSKNGSFFGGARFSVVDVTPGGVVTVGSSELKLTALLERQHLLPSSAKNFGALRGTALKMREVFAMLEQAAPSQATVLIEGETGTGKDLCAQAIHAASNRRAGPFVICDLATLPPTLIESELFGHEKGAFTGAVARREGAFVQADRGTLFIDELGELDLELQPRLLRALEQHKVNPVGASRYRPVDVRVIAATNRDLEAELTAGRFRADLYHRLAVVRIKLPPLRERKEDIPELVAQFLAGRPIEVPPITWALLAEYDWPGNVRELQNVVHRALALAGDRGVLDPSLLGLEKPLLDDGGTPTVAAAMADRTFHQAREQLIRSWERAYLTNLLERAGGNVSRAARLGGVARPYLHRLLSKHGLDSGGRATRNDDSKR